MTELNILTSTLPTLDASTLYDNSRFDYDAKLEAIEDSLTEAGIAYEFITMQNTNLLVTELADIYNLKTLKKLTPSMSSSGYYTVGLSSNGFTRNELVHRIVATAFVDNPNNYNSVDHIFPDKENNTAMNLQWLPLSVNQSKGNSKEWMNTHTTNTFTNATA